MTPSTAAQIVLLSGILWMIALAVLVWRPAPSWALWFLLLPVVVFLRSDPFQSVIGAAVIVVGSWALAVLFALSLPFESSLVRLGGMFLLLSVALLSVPSLLKRTVPARRWVGVALAGVVGPWGHWYVEGGGRW